jgi:hypothetical protein
MLAACPNVYLVYCVKVKFKVGNAVLPVVAKQIQLLLKIYIISTAFIILTINHIYQQIDIITLQTVHKS